MSSPWPVGPAPRSPIYRARERPAHQRPPVLAGQGGNADSGYADGTMGAALRRLEIVGGTRWWVTSVASTLDVARSTERTINTSPAGYRRVGVRPRSITPGVALRTRQEWAPRAPRRLE
jgi:hypothetical protein